MYSFTLIIVFRGDKKINCSIKKWKILNLYIYIDLGIFTSCTNVNRIVFVPDGNVAVS